MKIIAISILFFSSIVLADLPIIRGDRAIDHLNRTGLVLAVFSNGKAQVSFDEIGAPEVVPVKFLAKSIQCLNNFCVNQRVLTNLDEVGVIAEVFTNEKARVNLNEVAGSQVFLLRNLSVEVETYSTSDQ